MAHRVKWLIVFLVQNVHEVEKDTNYMDEVLEQLLLLKPMPMIGIAGCLCTSTLSAKLKDHVSPEIKEDGTLHSLILRLDHHKNGKSYMRLLKQMPQEKTNLFDAAVVSEILGFVRHQYEYEHVLLATWDHGSGYAIFAVPDARGEKEPADPLNGRHGVVHHPDHFAPMHRLFNRDALLQHAGKLRGEEHLKDFVKLLDDNLPWLSPPRGLTMDHLRKAILDSFGRVDVIFMRNCFMQIFDTGFALREATDYLVACESLMYFAAYDYSILLNEMQAGIETITPEEVAQAAIHGFTKRRTNPEIETDTALFGNNLNFYPALNYCMEKMIRILIAYAQKDKANKDALLHCRRSITDIVRRDFQNSTYQFVDAKLWFRKAGGLLGSNNAYWDALQDFQTLHEMMIGSRKFVGHMLSGGGYGESGFSLYFPGLTSNIEKYRSFYELYYALHTPFKSQFTRYSSWDEFIGYLFLDLPPH